MIQNGFPAECTRTALSEALASFTRATEGTTCQIEDLPYLSFQQWPALVWPKALERSTLLSPSPDMNAGQSPTLPRGTMVQLLKTNYEIAERTGKVCVFHQSAYGHQQLGWVTRHDLIELDDAVLHELPALPPAHGPPEPTQS